MNAHFSTDFTIQELNEMQSTLHHAAQFIAATGRHLIEQADDDSHTNMLWDLNNQQFIGGLIHSRAKVALRVPSLTLKVLGPGNLELAALNMNGKTKQESLSWLKKALMLKQIDGKDLHLHMHYEIPDHPTNHDKTFQSNPELLRELSRHRSFSEHILSAFSSKYEHASPLRTWPHHFDHGSYIPFEFDKEGSPVRSFSIGYAIADSIIDEPYLYVTQWQKDEPVDYSYIPDLKQGSWYPNKLKGAALKWSELMKSSDPESVAKTFLRICINWSVK